MKMVLGKATAQNETAASWLISSWDAAVRGGASFRVLIASVLAF
jgi:hypothetical protein